MKPLTIEQLKALEVGDWVWVIDKQTNRRKYRQLSFMWDDGELFGGTRFEFTSSRRQRGLHRHACNYGKTWLAYKNKEMAEAKGEIVELPCKIGDNGFVIIEDYSINRYKIEEINVIGFNFCQYDSSIWVVDEYNRSYGKFFKTKSEAEARLRELR